jgi:hypothetical protein
MARRAFESSTRTHRFGAKHRIDVRDMAEDFDETPPSSPRWIEPEDKSDSQLVTGSTSSAIFNRVAQKSTSTLFSKKFRLPFHFESECMNHHFIPPLEDFGWVSQPIDDPPLGLQNFESDDNSSFRENPYFY